MSDFDEYEDDFDEKLRGEFRVSDNEDDAAFGPEASPSPRLGASPHSSDGEGQQMMRMRVSKADALREARLSVMGSELSRALDLTIRPTTSGGRNEMGRSVALGSTAAASAAASSSSSAAAAAPAPESSLFSPSSLAPPASSFGVSLRPMSSGSMRQSQDMFAALDLANTDANLKQTYVKYWDAVEEQFQAEQKAEEELRIKRTQQAEKKHLARLKTKMALQREAAGAGGDRQQRQEAGWDSGFVFDKQLSPNKPNTKDPNAPAPTFAAPSVVKAQAALAAAMSGSTASALSGGSSNLSATAALGPKSAAGGSKSGVANAKAMPPAPAGIVDPARVRSVVQTHMPSYVLAKLARQRGISAKAALSATGAVRGASAARSRKGSAAATRPVISRRASNVSTGGGDDDAAAMFSEEISPSNLKSATSNASTMRPKSRVASAKSVRPGGAASAASATTATPGARAASAGFAVKPTNASMLAAAERAAQIHAAANPPDMKQIPLSQYNRMRREIEDLRRKCVALEAENEQLRSGASFSAAPAGASDSPPIKSPPNPSPTSSSTHSRTTSAAPSRATSAAATRPNLSATAGLASRPSAAAPASSPGPTPLAAVFQKAKHPGLKLNLASLRPDENGNPVIVAPPTGAAASSTSAASASSAANSLLSPRSRCAVSSCGQSRTPGKPYCAKHLAEQPQASPSAGALFSPKAVRSFESSPPVVAEPISISPPVSATVAASAAASSSAAPVVPIGGQGVGMHGLHFALGSGPPAKYNYDYESDDNYGGTDSEGEGSGSFDGSMSMSQSMGGKNKMRSSVQQSSNAEESDFGAHGGDTQRQMNTARGNNNGGTARAPLSSRTADPTPRAFTDSTPRQPPALLASQSQSSGSSAAPVVTRVKSDPSAIADHNALYSARPSQQPPRPSASATPRMSTTKPLDVHPGASPNAGAGFNLESLRASPYASMDVLGGSFEITQSGTFKRGGFSLNKHGMTTPASFAATPEGQQSGGSTQRTERGTKAFPWDATGGGSVPGSYRSSSGSALVTPTSAGMGSPQSGQIPSAGSSSVSTPSSTVASSPASSTPFFRPLNVSDLYTLGVLGRGSSGVVYRAFYAPTVELLAVKCISIVEKDKRKQLTQELRTLTLAPNPYTIGFRGAYFDDAHIYLALEFMDGGSLDDLVASSGPLSEIELAYIFEQVFLGLVHLEKSGIIHRDIKPHNILFDHRGRSVITDFGIISDLKQRSELADIQQAKTFVGTLLYMSPERISGKEYGFPADIWSTGLSMLTCRVGDFAIRHDSHWELVNTIQQGEKMLERFGDEVLSEQLRDLLSHCLRADPLARPTASECLRHPFFAHFRSQGSSQPIPRPPHFPPPPAAKPASSALSPRDSKAARKAAEVESRNEKHMLEQVCRLMVHKGMTSRPQGPPAASPSAAGGAAVLTPSPPAPIPIDGRLCERICDRLSSLLKVPAAHVRSVLIHTHNQYVGLA